MPIQLPDRMFAAPELEPAAPPPVDPMVAREQQIADTTRAEEAVNCFLAAKQHALFEAPDAFYRQQGEDAIHAAPVATQKLDELRRDLLERLGNDAQRQRLSDALDAQMHLARDGMSRHVAEQSHAWQRSVAQDRIALLAKEAVLHHNDDSLVDAIGHAAATAARAHARVGDGLDQQAEDAAAAYARSGVFNAAIQSRLDRGNANGASALLTRVNDQLDPAHAAPLKAQIAQAPSVDAPAVSSSSPNVERPISESERDAAQAILDSQPVGRRGIAPVVEPLPGSPEYEEASDSLPGTIAVMPNGDKVRDDDPSIPPSNKSDTGFMMSPVTDLSAVAEAGREARKQLRGVHFTNPLDLPADFVVTLLRNVGTLGKFDYQRRGPQLEGLRDEALRRIGVSDDVRKKLGGEPIQRRQFRNVSNFNVGFFLPASGNDIGRDHAYCREICAVFRQG